MLVPDMRNVHKSAVHLAMCLVPTLQALADSLRVNKSMTTINLWRNNFGDEGVKARGPWLGGGLWINAIQMGDDCSAARGVV